MITAATYSGSRIIAASRVDCVDCVDCGGDAMYIALAQTERFYATPYFKDRRKYTVGRKCRWTNRTEIQTHAGKQTEDLRILDKEREIKYFLKYLSFAF